MTEKGQRGERVMGGWAFILGMVVGGSVGVVLAGLLRSAHDGDLLTPEQMECILEDVLEVTVVSGAQ